MKQTLFVVLALAVGAVVGGLVAYAGAQTRIAEAEVARDKLAKELEHSHAALAETEGRLGQFETENRILQQQIRVLKDAATAAVAPAPLDTPPPDAALAASGTTPPEEPGPLPEESPANRERRRLDNLPEDVRERMEGRREQFAQEFRDRRDEFFQREYTATTDATVQERLTQMRDYTESMMELRQAMRDAKTDEEREALRQTMNETYGALRDLTVTQQDYLIRELGKQYGVTDTQKQEQFVAAVRDMQSSPYFRPERMVGWMGGPPHALEGAGPGPQQP